MLVVGGGNSGFHIAEELAATRTVDLSIATKNPMLPQRRAGQDLFWWLTRLGVMRVTRAVDFASLAPQPTQPRVTASPDGTLLLAVLLAGGPSVAPGRRSVTRCRGPRSMPAVGQPA